MSLLTLIGVVLTAIALAFGAGEWHGRGVGKDEIRAEWRDATAQAESDRNKSLSKDRDTAYAMAAEYESQLHNLKASDAKRSTDRRAALALPASCPASGAVGDIVLPAALVRGMLVDDDNAAGPPGPAASQSGAGLRYRPTSPGG